MTKRLWQGLSVQAPRPPPGEGAAGAGEGGSAYGAEHNASSDNTGARMLVSGSWARLSSASRITSATSAWLVGLSPARTDPHAKMFGLIAERYGRLRGAGPRDPAGVSGR